MSRHERRKEKSLAREFPASTEHRVMTFLDAFRRAPNDADFEIRIGSSEFGQRAILVSFAGTEHALLVSEARKVAGIMEEAMNAHPDDPEGATLPNIIMGLRHGCDVAEATT